MGLLEIQHWFFTIIILLIILISCYDLAFSSICNTFSDVRQCTFNPCQNSGQCERRGSSFRCNCKPGFTGNLCQVASPGNTAMLQTKAFKTVFQNTITCNIPMYFCCLFFPIMKRSIFNENGINVIFLYFIMNSFLNNIVFQFISVSSSCPQSEYLIYLSFIMNVS